MSETAYKKMMHDLIRTANQRGAERTKIGNGADNGTVAVQDTQR